jgi:FtsP/CotA-like multicopper oxidase with cupredoxin domain
MLQIASDGGLLESPVARSSFPLHPAERIEVLIDFRGFKPGSEIVLQNTAADAGTTKSVMRFDVVGGGGSEEARMPRGRMRTLEKLPPPNASRRWDLSLLTQSGVQWQIANRGFDPNRIDVSPRLGTSELWQWHNPSNRVHPMHLHGMLFRVVERSSGVIHPGERSWKDTVGVLPGETVTVQPWFIPYAGRYVFHCHSLEHGDKAMMLQLEVVR